MSESKKPTVGVRCLTCLTHLTSSLSPLYQKTDQPRNVLQKSTKMKKEFFLFSAPSAKILVKEFCPWMH